jgi:hypothetical protein
MRMRKFLLVLAIALGVELGSSATAPAAPATSFDAGQIAELITQLGSPKFKEREAAMEALDAIGVPALEALQRAAWHSDPEIGRRAQNLAHTIRRRIETAQFITPLRLHLDYQNTPVLQAVEDFARKTGFAIEASPQLRLKTRRITLDTGETSFWKAFDQFCQKAGLVEKMVTPESDSPTPSVWGATRGRRGGVQLVELPSNAHGWDGSLLLTDGQAAPPPTYYAGAVRFRALPANGSDARTGADEVGFLLEITPQPKLVWHNVIDVRIDKAVDENGQDLAPSQERRNDGNPGTVLINGVALLDAQTGRPLLPVRSLPVCLKSGDKVSHVLKEVKGIVAAQVETAPQALITVENLFASAGKTFRGEDGESLKVIEASRQVGGDVQVQLEFIDSSSANAQWIVRRGMMRPRRGGFGMGRRGWIEDNSPPPNLLLQDANGHNFPLRNRDRDDVSIRGNGLVREITLTYCGGLGLGEPKKLVYSGRRTILVEIPFTLKDVPVR